MTTLSTTSALEAMHRLSLAIASATAPHDVYELLLDSVVELFQVERASIMIFDPAVDGLRVVAARGMEKQVVERAIVRVGEGISGKVFASHTPLLIKDIKAQGLGPTRDRYKTTSLMSAPVTCFPMRMGKETIGIINVTDRKNGKSFDSGDLQLLTTISNQAAAFIHITQLSEKLAAGERLREQLEIARQIQYRLIPERPPALSGCEVAGQLITAERVGGDYYDYQGTPGAPRFVVADVSGHSIGAALLMSAFRSALRAEWDTDLAPAELATRINRILYEDLYQAEQFISMAYARYDDVKKSLAFTIAGHPPPLLWRAQGKMFEALSTDDPLLGVEAKSFFHEKSVSVMSGDLVVFYTDGVTEATNREGERFGVERLKEAIADAASSRARHIVDVLVETVSLFMDPLPPKDDITALVIKIS